MLQRIRHFLLVRKGENGGTNRTKKRGASVLSEMGGGGYSMMQKTRRGKKGTT